MEPPVVPQLAHFGENTFRGRRYRDSGGGIGGEAPMLIFKEALEIFVYKCFAYLHSRKYAFLF